MIVNLRGASGSGKTKIVRDLMEQLGSTPIIDEQGKIEGYLLGQDIRVVGKYSNPCGGCDTIRDMDQVEARIRRYAEASKHVLFEGLIVTGVFSRWFNLAKEYDFIWAPLDTPLEICHQRVLQRNGGKPISVKNLENKYKGSYSCAQRALAAGQRVEWIHYEDPTPQVLRLFQ